MLDPCGDMYIPRTADRRRRLDGGVILSIASEDIMHFNAELARSVLDHKTD